MTRAKLRTIAAERAEEADRVVMGRRIAYGRRLGRCARSKRFQANRARPKFGGVIKEDAAELKTWWPPRIVPPKGAPNILLIMTDDQGYGVSGTFGGVIPTPALDRIAKAGLRYTEFNSTALCSPTRAALITGRNHHSGGFGVITELSTGFPGYDSIIGQDNATIGISRPHNPRSNPDADPGQLISLQGSALHLVQRPGIETLEDLPMSFLRIPASGAGVALRCSDGNHSFA